jgi:tRNA-dihydrouridine synthase
MSINIIPKTLDEAIHIANEIERYEGVLKQLKDALKKFVKANGAVNTGEKIWDMFPIISWDVSDPRLLAEKIFDKGDNPWAFVKIDLKAVLQKGILTEQEAMQYGAKQKLYSRFGSTKVDAAGSTAGNDNTENVA